MMFLALGGLLTLTSASYQPFWQNNFEDRINNALVQVRSVLDSTRRPALPSSVDHAYGDKYALVEAVAEASVASQLNALHLADVSLTTLLQLKDQASKGNRRTFLEFHQGFAVKFDRVEEDRVEIGGKTTNNGAVTETEFRTEKHYFWTLTHSWNLTATTKGANAKVKMITEYSTSGMKKTSSSNPPWAERQTFAPEVVDITWLLRHLTPDGTPVFRIDREAASCHTPRRNEETIQLLEFFGAMGEWSVEVEKLLSSLSGRGDKDNAASLQPALRSVEEVFAVLPLFEKPDDTDSPKQPRVASGADDPSPSDQPNQVKTKGSQGTDGDSTSVLLSRADREAVVQGQADQLQAWLQRLVLDYPTTGEGHLLTRETASAALIARHMAEIGNTVAMSVNYVEGLLAQQLIAAIGKEIQPSDFDEYMAYHARGLFLDAYRPNMFSYAVRREGLFPEGLISIESPGQDGAWQPISTITRKREATSPMSFAINAGTQVSFMGARYVHAALRHRFSSQMEAPFRLVARARQFSSFILVLGNLVSSTELIPDVAVVVQNKDSVFLDLIMETLPSATEFKDAISSLSPEQRRFAQAFRSMQLGSTLFSVCVVQIKPQLELLLELPEHSLTKEILLTQQLMDLFVEYQIPPDMLSFEGDADTAVNDKLDKVKSNVEKIQAIIKQLTPTPAPTPQPSKPYPTSRPDYYPEYETVYMERGQSAGGMQFERAVPSSAFPVPVPVNVPVSVKVQVPRMEADDGRDNDAASGGKDKAGASHPDSEPQMGGEGGAYDLDDYSAIPSLLEQRSSELALPLRPTIIRAGNSWRRDTTDIEGKSGVEYLQSSTLEKERNKAFDLLDALSRSGALPIHSASLHVVLASTHAFDKTLLDTVIEDNVNPIERVEESILTIASTVHGLPVTDLVKEDQLPRLSEFNAAIQLELQQA